ncbi:MAG TPA: nitroreductase family protein [Terracidiphilus sp.]|nr:nitroreductase family protein [Terracidiphilus sp.]
MTLSMKEAHQIKVAPDVEGLLPAIRERWSPRSFTERAVSTAQLAALFEAARWAPSSSNEQPWRYILGLNGSATHEKIAETLVGFNRHWALKAPLLVLGTARTLGGKRNAPNAYAMYDLGAATALLVVEAQALGLATHQMGGFDHDAVRKALEIPEEYAIGSVIALGYQAEPAELPNETLIARETEPRSRKPLNEIVYSAWDVPAELG